MQLVSPVCTRTRVHTHTHANTCMAPGRLSCLPHQTGTLSSSTFILSTPVSHMYSTQQQCKMVDVVDVLTRLRVVTEFLTAEGSMPIRIHRI